MLFWSWYLGEGRGPYLAGAMVEQQLDSEVGLQLPLEGSTLQHTAQWGDTAIVNGIDVGPLLQEEVHQRGIGCPTCLVQGAPLCLIQGIDTGAVGSQQLTKLQTALSSAWCLPTKDTEGCLLLCAVCINMSSMMQVEAGMVTETMPGCHMQCCLSTILCGQVDSGSMSQQELGTSAKRWRCWTVCWLEGFCGAWFGIGAIGDGEV